MSALTTSPTDIDLDDRLTSLEDRRANPLRTRELVAEWCRREAKLTEELERLRAGIRAHRDARGDDRCYLDDAALYALLGEEVKPETALPPREVFLANCARFHASRQAPGDTLAPGHMEGRWVTGAELQGLHRGPKLCVAVLATNAAGQVLLIKHRQRGWELPGGKLEAGERWRAAAHREAAEETGLDVVPDDSPPEVRDGLPVNGAHYASVVLVVSARAEGTPRAGDDAEDARWFDLEEVPWEDLSPIASAQSLKAWAQYRGHAPSRHEVDVAVERQLDAARARYNRAFLSYPPNGDNYSAALRAVLRPYVARELELTRAATTAAGRRPPGQWAGQVLTTDKAPDIGAVLCPNVDPNWLVFIHREGGQLPTIVGVFEDETDARDFHSTKGSQWSGAYLCRVVRQGQDEPAAAAFRRADEALELVVNDVSTAKLRPLLETWGALREACGAAASCSSCGGQGVVMPVDGGWSSWPRTCTTCGGRQRGPAPVENGWEGLRVVIEELTSEEGDDPAETAYADVHDFVTGGQLEEDHDALIELHRDRVNRLRAALRTYVNEREARAVLPP